MVFSVPGANYGACFVNAEFSLYTRFGGAFEEIEDMLAVFMLFLFVMLGLFGGYLVLVLVYCLVDFLV